MKDDLDQRYAWYFGGHRAISGRDFVIFCRFNIMFLFWLFIQLRISSRAPENSKLKHKPSNEVKFSWEFQFKKSLSKINPHSHDDGDMKV